MSKDHGSIYCYPKTNILINKLNIQDFETLKKYETSIVSLKLMALTKKGITGNFDINHFINIHKFLFEDIYPFAGKLRTENIAKNYFQFAQFEYIEAELTKLLNKLKEEQFLTNLDKKNLSSKLAFYWAELNVLHPFREGNGRTTREFLRQLALKNNYQLNLHLVDSNQLLEASIKSIINSSDLELLIFQCLDNK